jgi:hypothetical protein
MDDLFRFSTLCISSFDLTNLVCSDIYVSVVGDYISRRIISIAEDYRIKGSPISVGILWVGRIQLENSSPILRSIEK